MFNRNCITTLWDLQMSVVTYLCNQYASNVNLKPTDIIYKEIGARIIAARKAKNMSQEQLAVESGIDRSHMGFIEQGRRKPTISTLHKIASTLGISLEKLFKQL
jgi:DNA-binding XRE family transcriptional regulator